MASQGSSWSCPSLEPVSHQIWFVSTTVFYSTSLYRLTFHFSLSLSLYRHVFTHSPFIFSLSLLCYLLIFSADPSFSLSHCSLVYVFVAFSLWQRTSVYALLHRNLKCLVRFFNNSNCWRIPCSFGSVSFPSSLWSFRGLPPRTPRCELRSFVCFSCWRWKWRCWNRRRLRFWQWVWRC